MSINSTYTWSTWTLLILLCLDGYFAKIPIYMNPCNETIFLDNTNSAGKMVYHHTPSVSDNQCNIIIETSPGYHIGYAFKQTTAFRQIFIQNDNIFYTCTTVILYTDGVERLGCDDSNYTDKLHTTRSNTLTLDVRGDDLSDFKFELVFFIFHYAKCNSYEVRCINSLMDNYNSVCIDRSLACDETYNFCDKSSSECSDITISDSFNFKGSLIAAIVLLCIIIVPLLTMSACVVYRKLCKRQEPEENTPTRARRIFAAIVAEAQENAGYDTEPVDPSKFDPPPEYGSLEHLDGASCSSTHCDKQLSQISVECPPCYNDVMSNSNEYLVSSHM